MTITATKPSRDIFMQKGEGEAKAEQLFELGALGFDVPDSTDVSGADQGSAAWLREQFVSGALPKDPLLVRSLLEYFAPDYAHVPGLTVPRWATEAVGAECIRGLGL